MEFDLNKCYEILDVEPGASLSEIKAAYKHLAIVWHPDRMPSDNLELKEKATNKLKELNYAYARLKSVAKNSDEQTGKYTSKRSTKANETSPSASNCSTTETSSTESFIVQFENFDSHELLKEKLLDTIFSLISAGAWGLLLMPIMTVLIRLRLTLTRGITFSSILSWFYLGLKIYLVLFAPLIFLSLIMGISNDIKYIPKFSAIVNISNFAFTINKKGLKWNYYSGYSSAKNTLDFNSSKILSWKDIQKIERCAKTGFKITINEKYYEEAYVSIGKVKILSKTLLEILEAIEYYSERKFTVKSILSPPKNS